MKAPVKSTLKLLGKYLCLLLFVVTMDNSALAKENIGTEEHKELIKHRVENLDDRLNYRYTSEVDSFIQIYYRQRISVITKGLRRSETYFPFIDSVLVAHNIPWKLRYIAVIESLLDPKAVSPAGATGMWQFMPGTAKMYGLEVSDEKDERLDYKKSTIAAAHYLKDLKDQFGDWFLAMAAYNNGPGNIRSHIRRADGNYAFHKIKRFLPKETYEYIPKFTAVSYLMEFAPEYKLVPRRPNVHLLASLPTKYTSIDNTTDVASVEISESHRMMSRSKSILNRVWNAVINVFAG